MSEDTHHETILDDEATKYVIAASIGNQYKYPEGWEKNVKRSVISEEERG